MKKTRVLSVVLVMTMVIPLTACFRSKKDVIEVTDKYMQAVISLDKEDIADLMDKDTGVNDVFAPYDLARSENAKYDYIYDAIAESITYEIDEKSIEFSSKDKSAGCDVTVHIVDYKTIFEDVDRSRGDIDDYIDALEDADEDNTIDIDLGFEYVYRDGKWFIKDKRAENLREIFSFFSDVREFRLYNTFLERAEARDIVDSGKKFKIYDEDFNDLIVEARWWDYGDTMSDPGQYNTGTETLAFSIEVNEDAEDDVYYAYYYSVDREFDRSELSKPLFGTMTSVEEYLDGKAYYNIDCSMGIQKGHYVVVVASDESLKNIYVVAYCEVK